MIHTIHIQSHDKGRMQVHGGPCPGGFAVVSMARFGAPGMVVSANMGADELEAMAFAATEAAERIKRHQAGQVVADLFKRIGA